MLELAGRQHGLVTHTQLVRLGMTPEAIRHRLQRGRLFRVHRGVFSLSTPKLSRHARWMAAVLACGGGAALSHWDAGALLELCAPSRRGPVHVSVPNARNPRVPGVQVHRRTHLTEIHVGTADGIPVTCPALTIADLAGAGYRNVERMVNEADKLELIDVPSLRAAMDELDWALGASTVRDLLDSHTFTLTDSELERRLIPIALRAGLGMPVTGETVNGFDVDFWWPELGLVVETDGLTYHRTPTQQARDRVRDHAHVRAGLTPLRFTRAQVRFEPRHVEETLRQVTARLAAARPAA